jgi:hypothetical protein
MTTGNYVDPMSVLAAAPLTTTTPASGKSGSSSTGSWFQALASAWGQALDQQADIIAKESDTVGTSGADSPSAITQLTADTMKMSFLSQEAQTSDSSAGKSLETLARGQ